jgi:hypothetical protein
MTIKLVPFAERLFVGALGVAANERIDVDVIEMSPQGSTKFEVGLRGTLWPRALASTRPMRNYFVHMLMAMGRLIFSFQKG